jgi:hypothetical protein
MDYLVHPELVGAAALREAAALTLSNRKDKRELALRVIQGAQQSLQWGSLAELNATDHITQELQALNLQLAPDATPPLDDLPDGVAQSLYHGMSTGSLPPCEEGGAKRRPSAQASSPPNKDARTAEGDYE